MRYTTTGILKECEKRNIHLWNLAVEDEVRRNGTKEEKIFEEFHKMLKVMENSSSHYLNEESVTNMKMIDGFSKKMHDYYEKNDSFCGSEIIYAMAMAFSTIEVNASMGKIVAAPTAGASGILPAAFMTAKRRYNFDDDTLVKGLLTSSFVGQVIGKYFNFAGAEGGCQAECGSAASMAAAGLVFMKGGDAQKCFNAASFALLNVMGLVCDPVAGLVEYPCAFRNSSGVINALICADMALAGVNSAVPFEEVLTAADIVGKSLPHALRETGIGGVAGTPAACKIKKEYVKMLHDKKTDK